MRLPVDHATATDKAPTTNMRTETLRYLLTTLSVCCPRLLVKKGSSGCGACEAVPMLRKAAAVFVATAVSAVAVGCSGRDSGRTSGGPLACNDCADEAVSLPIDAGSPFTHGQVIMTNAGSHDVTLESINLTQLRGHLKVLNVLVAPLGRAGMVGILQGFPPPRRYLHGARPVRGYVIKPNKRAELLIGLKTTGPGIASYEGVDVYYTADHSRYRTAYQEHLRACTPLKRYLHHCPNALDQRPAR
jgi:hypothetical protein